MDATELLRILRVTLSSLCLHPVPVVTRSGGYIPACIIIVKSWTKNVLLWMCTRERTQGEVAERGRGENKVSVLKTPSFSETFLHVPSQVPILHR